MKRSLGTLLRRVNRPVPLLPSAPSARQFRRRDLCIDATLLFTLISIVLVIVVDLRNLRVPFMYAGDPLLSAMHVKTMMETGWIQHTSRLGAPFGQVMHDFPLGGDNGNFAIFFVLSRFTDNWGLVLNLFFLLGFYLVGFSAWAVARLLGCTRVTALAAALLFDFSVFHFARFRHIFLADYWMLPLAVLVAVRAAQGRSFSRGRRLATAATIGMSLVIGSFGAYYAVFAALTVGMMCLLTAVGFQTIRPLLHGLAVSLAIGVTLIVNESPSLLYAMRHGTNSMVAARDALELDLYGLRLIQLVTPPAGGHFSSSWLGSWSWRLSQGYESEGGQNLGTVTALLLVCLLFAVLVHVVRPGALETEWMAKPLVATAALAWILIASTGGLVWILWALGFHHMRAWGRVSILIMFLVLIWGAITVSSWERRASRETKKGIRPAVIGTVLAATCFGVAEQTPPQFPAGRRADTHAYEMRAYESDRDYFPGVERELGRRASAFVLPVRRFPEELPIVESGDYQMVQPFLHTEEMRFSYGGMKGRQAEWMTRLIGLGPEQVVQGVAAVGFSAILIDRAGYEDRGKAIEAALAGLLSASPMVSPDSRWATFDLRGWLKSHPPSATLRRHLLEMPILVEGDCKPPEGYVPPVVQLTCRREGTIAVVTPNVGAERRSLKLDVRSPSGGGQFWISGPGMDGQSYRLGRRSTTISLKPMKSGLTTYEFHTDIQKKDGKIEVTADLPPIFRSA